jgi:cyclohexa-1,5-dienecarbonyl-CoA hydratase
MTDFVRVITQDGVGKITLANPPLNILTRDMLGAIRAHCVALVEDTDLRAFVIDAEGKHFSAGADVGEHMPPTYRELIPEFLDTIHTIVSAPCPVIASVHGRCVGGGFEVALAADMVVAADDALFGQPEINLGVLAPAACVLLPRKCAPNVAAELLHTGTLIDAHEARRIGIVNHIVPTDDLQSRTDALVSEIATHSAAALRIGKQMMHPDAERLSEHLAMAASRYVDDLMSTKDAVEGLTAFLEKREPTWSHR